jgi:23S rRNA (guanosine2251-2'-O)-methyltransferase
MDVVFGINPVQESLRGRLRRPLELFISRERSSRLQELVRDAEGAGVPLRFRERSDLDRLAGTPHHQGAVLRVEPFAYASLDDLLAAWRGSGRPALFLVLDGVTDPHNLGALLRSADAAGSQGAIIPKDRACQVTATVDKAAAGALAHVPLCRVTNLARTLEELKREGVWILGLAGGEGSAPLYEADLTGDVALVVGSEGEGLRHNVRRHCDLLLSIPMQGALSSLNASVAGAIALFEGVRQRTGLSVK